MEKRTMENLVEDGDVSIYPDIGTQLSLLEDKEKITDDEIKMIVNDYWYGLIVRLQTIGQNSIDMEVACRNFVEVNLGRYLLNGPLAKFRKRGNVILKMLKSQQISLEVVDHLNQEYPNFFPANFRERIIKMFGDANHTFKGRLGTILDDDAI